VAKKLIATSSSIVALAAVAIAGSATPAGARPDATACAGKLRAAVAAPGTRLPIALVPGLRYDPGTMIPRGVTPASAQSDPTACTEKPPAAVADRSTRLPVALVPGLEYDPETMVPRGIG
jgi:hypothetical protein